MKWKIFNHQTVLFIVWFPLILCMINTAFAGIDPQPFSPWLVGRGQNDNIIVENFEERTVYVTVTAINPFTGKILDRAREEISGGKIAKIVITGTIPQAHWSHLVVETEMDTIEGQDNVEPWVRITRLLVDKKGTVLLQRYNY